ncbi:hypothetical protein ACHAWF_000388 [Thalassiosira exigua]
MDEPPSRDDPDPMVEAPMASIAPNASGWDADSASLRRPGRRGGVPGANIRHGVARTPYAPYARIIALPSSPSSSNPSPSETPRQSPSNPSSSSRSSWLCTTAENRNASSSTSSRRSTNRGVPLPSCPPEQRVPRQRRRRPWSLLLSAVPWHC